MCSLLEQFEEASQSIDSDLAFDLDFPKRYGLEFTTNKVFYFFCALILFFSCASAKAERGLSSLSCVWMYVEQNKETPPPQKWHFYWEFLDFKSGFGFTTKN